MTTAITPTEIAATLDALRQAYAGRRIVLVFQPHRFTRTRDLMDDFARVLATADTLFVTEVYAAGEAPIDGADGRAICRAVRGRGKVEPVFVPTVEELADALHGLVKPGDVIAMMGAGSISAAAHELAPRLRALQAGEGALSFTVPAEFDRACVAPTAVAPYLMACGRPADIFFMPRDRADLIAFLKALPAEVPLLWLGLGSNLLVRDGGVRGVVISTRDALTALERRDERGVYAEAGLPCAKLARACARWDLGPAEFFSGIPGTVGGALAMNAGASTVKPGGRCARCRPSIVTARCASVTPAISRELPPRRGTAGR